MKPDQMSAEEKLFSRQEMADDAAAVHLVQNCRERYGSPAPPSRWAFLVRDPVGEASSRLAESATGSTEFLLDDEGRFREWINISPALRGKAAPYSVVDLAFDTLARQSGSASYSIPL